MDLSKERHEAVMDIGQSLERLHQVFLDMAVFVEGQGHIYDVGASKVSKSHEGHSTLSKSNSKHASQTILVAIDLEACFVPLKGNCYHWKDAVKNNSKVTNADQVQEFKSLFRGFQDHLSSILKDGSKQCKKIPSVTVLDHCGFYQAIGKPKLIYMDQELIIDDSKTLQWCVGRGSRKKQCMVSLSLKHNWFGKVQGKLRVRLVQRWE
ncbi:hypothetical protein PTKIN_Ptkin08bG0186200 [Pterospermum kingtungense]